MGESASHKSVPSAELVRFQPLVPTKEFIMETFDDFLKRFIIRELKENKPNGKPFWQADEKEGHYRSSTLTGNGIIWELRRAWTSRYARTYRDNKEKWWVGEVGSRRGFKTEKDARKHQLKLIK